MASRPDDSTYRAVADDRDDAYDMEAPEAFKDPILSGDVGGKPKFDSDADTHALGVTFEEVSYTLTKWSMRGRKVIALLQDVTGYIKPGEMLALMGPSGCGKTTLLDVLAGRKTQGAIEGRVLFGGHPPDGIMLRRHTGYVEQQDTLLSMLTVHEMLLYTAELKLPRDVSGREKRSRVDELVDLLGLMPCKHTCIGSQMKRGISGGQARRVSLGVSLITRPKVLFLDEPTSGLDARTSDQIIRIIRNLCLEQKVAVCSTIHTPTNYCFSQFDRLMLMAQGRIIYFGANGAPVLSHFAALDYLPREGDSPAEGAIDIVTRIQEEDRVLKMATKFSASAEAAANGQALKQLLSDAAEADDVMAEQGDRANKATVTPSWWAAITFFRFRTLKNYTALTFLGPRLLPTLLFTGLMSLLYQGQGNNNGVMSLVNVSALNFMWVVVPAFAAGAYTPSISLERTLFYRERNDGLYRTSTYLACKMAEELLVMIIYSAGVSAMVFYIVQLHGSFLLFWLVFLTANAVSVAFAYLVAAAAPNLDVANAVVPAFMMLMLFFAGFLIMVSAMPVWLQWVPYVNFLKYGFTALQTNHWDNVDTPIVDVDALQASIANKTASFVSNLAINNNIPVIGEDGQGAAPAPDAGGVGGFFKGAWEDMKQSISGAFQDVTHDVTQSVAEKVFGISIDTATNALNQTLINATSQILASVRGQAGKVNLQIGDIRNLTWGNVILTVVDSGPPYNPWVNWFVQSLFFVFFVVGAWLSMAFIQHQHR